MVSIDVVFLSWAKDEILRQLMVRALDSLAASEDPNHILFHVVVVESNKDVNYDIYQNRQAIATCQTLHPDTSFGYHKYLNIGVRAGNSPYVVLCNSDIGFYLHWASEIVEAMEVQPDILSASPRSATRFGVWEKQNKNPVDGYQIRHHIAGWCIFQQRKIYDILGQLDERFIFWYADNDYAEELKKHKIRHCLVPSSRVDHHHRTVGRTGASLHVKEFEEYTKKQRVVFTDKWGFEPP